jgi:hypothetical protein
MFLGRSRKEAGEIGETRFWILDFRFWIGGKSCYVRCLHFNPKSQIQNPKSPRRAATRNKQSAPGLWEPNSLKEAS